MTHRILVLNGHPDTSPKRFCAALANAYQHAALASGHEVRRLNIGALDFPLIRSRADFEGETPKVIADAQADIHWADHILLVHPLWLGAAPALTKAFFEQVFRYGFALPDPGGRGLPIGKLVGRSARIVVTMGMPASFYGLVFGAFGVRAMERSILRLAGIGPIRHAFVGMVEGPAKEREAWLNRAKIWGRAGI